jgi:hypothetical protein
MGNGRRFAIAGFTGFAGAIMILSGIWGALLGIAAIAKDKFFVVAPNYVYKIDTTGWGWIHLILGILVAVAGICLLLGQTWARLTALVLACISAIAQFMFLPYYPLWAILIIALDIFVIWALAADPDQVPA